MERKPDWIKGEYDPAAVQQTQQLLADLGLNTVCDEAACPNRGECFRKKTATFMILGIHCTRRCRFCNVTKADPTPLDPDEPRRVAEAAVRLGLRHAVVTSVTRDDLPDGGAGHFAAVIRALRTADSEITTEVLVPDFAGKTCCADIILDAAPRIFGHNLETVPRLYAQVRPGADYLRSLKLLEYACASGVLTKTGIMLGLSETPGEVSAVIRDAAAAGVSILTIGQYLRPSKAHLPVSEYIHPEVFTGYAEEAREAGIKFVSSAPLVRSSYNAAEALLITSGLLRKDGGFIALS